MYFCMGSSSGVQIYLAVLVALFAGLAITNAFMSIQCNYLNHCDDRHTDFFRGLAQVIAGDNQSEPDSFIGINIENAGIPFRS